MEARLLKLTFAAPILIGLSSGCTGLDTAASDEPGSVIVAVKSAPAPPPIVRSAEPPGEVRPLFRPLVRQRAKATPPPVAVVRPRRMLEPAPRHPPLPQPVEAPDP